MKKGYFFTLDAFIAMSILIFCVIMIFSIHSTKPYPLQSLFLSDDVMYIISDTKIYELQSDYVQDLYDNGDITNRDNTLLEQIAVFHITGRDSLADYFAINITSTIVPSKYGFQLRIYNSTDEYTARINPGQIIEADSRLIVTSKKIISGVVNDTGWGPMTAEVRLWQ